MACWPCCMEELERDSLDDYCAEARDELRREIVEALTAGVASRIVQAPAYSGRWTLEEISSDDIAGEKSTTLADLLSMGGRLARSGDAQAVTFINALADRHAEFHADDRAEELRQEAREA